MSKPAHQLTKEDLRKDKLDRFVLSLYEWFHQSGQPDTLVYRFEKKSSLLHCYLVKSDPEHYRAEFRYVDRTDWRSETLSKEMIVSRIDPLLFTILKTMALIYQHYQGKLHYTSNPFLLKKNRLSAQDKTRLQAIYTSKQCDIPQFL